MVYLGQVGAVQVRNHGDSCLFMVCGVLPRQIIENVFLLLFTWGKILFSKVNGSVVWPVKSIKKVPCVIQSIVVVFR